MGKIIAIAGPTAVGKTKFAIESQDMISPSKRFAISMANFVFPTAVGPAIAIILPIF